MSKNIKTILAVHALMGFVAWYAIEKVFLRSIDISLFQISILAVIYIGSSALINLPSGIFADKYGRKKALIISSFFLLASTLVAALSQNFWHYAVAGILWGLFWSTQSGAYSAILYDTLKQERKEKLFAKIKGLSGTLFWMSIFISSLAGAWIGENFGLRQAYYFTIIPNILCIFLCFWLKEPKIKEKSATEEKVSFAKEGLNALLSKSSVVKLSSLYLMLQLMAWGFNEFDQLYTIELGFSVLAIGLINAFSGLGQAAGSFFGNKFEGKTNTKIIILTVYALFLIMFLLPQSQRLIIVIAFLVFQFVRESFYLVTETQLQHSIPSRVRATSFSTLGMINDIILVIGFLTFGIVSEIYDSARIGFFVFAIIGVFILFSGRFLAQKKSISAIHN